MYTLTVITEELRGRMREERVTRIRKAADACEAFIDAHDEIARRHDVTFEVEVDEFTTVMEFFPKMRAVITLREAD